MTRGRPRPLAAAVLIAVAAMAGAGCGSDARSASGAAAAGATTKASARDGALKFAACMREHGVRDFPDPDASGELTIDGVVNGSSLDTDSASWKQALSACRDLQPAGFTGRRRSTAQQGAALRFARCIRDNGVRDFPDPVNGEPLVNTYKIPSSNEPGGMAVLDAAMKTCGDLAATIVGRP